MWVAWSQHVVDPSNILPVGVAIVIGVLFVVAAIVTKDGAHKEVRALRQAVYCRGGSFEVPVALPGAPRDIRQRDAQLQPAHVASSLSRLDGYVAGSGSGTPFSPLPPHTRGRAGEGEVAPLKVEEGEGVGGGWVLLAAPPLLDHFNALT